MSSPVIPTMRYNDAGAMAGWLCNTFGFARHLVVEDENGGVVHAQLTFGTGMVMLGGSRDDDFDDLQYTPRKLGGTTQSAYVIVPDVDVIAEKARAAGAKIVRAPQDEEYGGRSLSLRDPEGHLWNFGTYDPWAK